MPQLVHRVRSLNCFGFIAVGLQRRPSLLSKEAGDKAIVKNMSEFYANSNSICPRPNFVPCYKGVRSPGFVLDQDVLNLQRQLEDEAEARKVIKQVRRRIKSTQKRPTAYLSV